MLHQAMVPAQVKKENSDAVEPFKRNLKALKNFEALRSQIMTL